MNEWFLSLTSVLCCMINRQFNVRENGKVFWFALLSSHSNCGVFISSSFAVFLLFDFCQHKCYIVATCDKDLKRRIRKIPGVPIMYVKNHQYSVERLPDVNSSQYNMIFSFLLLVCIISRFEFPFFLYSPSFVCLISAQAMILPFWSSISSLLSFVPSTRVFLSERNLCLIMDFLHFSRSLYHFPLCNCSSVPASFSSDVHSDWQFSLNHIRLSFRHCVAGTLIPSPRSFCFNFLSLWLLAPVISSLSLVKSKQALLMNLGGKNSKTIKQNHNLLKTKLGVDEIETRMQMVRKNQKNEEQKKKMMMMMRRRRRMKRKKRMVMEAEKGMKKTMTMKKKLESYQLFLWVSNK